jgi:hypothetical protein
MSFGDDRMKRATFSTLIPLILLAGCGSSDGGISPPGDNNPPPPPAGFAITSANGMQVSQVAYQAVITSGDIAGLAGSSGIAANPGGGLAKPGIQEQFAGTLAGILQKVLVGPTVVDCLSGGTVTVTMDVADLNVLLGGMLSVGDTILTEYAMCDEGLGEVINGTIDSEVDAFNGNILVSSYDMTMTMNVTNFQVTTAADVITGNGDATATLNSLAAPYVEASVTGNLMTTDTNSSFNTLSNYSSAQTLDATVSPAPYTMDSSGTLDSSELAGAVTYSTPTLFQGFDTDYPNAGVLLVSSASGSATLTAEMNGVDVTIRIYSSADGTGDPVDTIMTTWAELAGM